MLTKNELKSYIINANNQYRIGKPIVSDQEFDDLCESYSKLIDNTEWEEFKQTLHENPGKIQHQYIAGSLNKLKYEEPDNIIKFIKKIGKSGKLNISKKIDGISAILTFKDGKLVLAASRGNGYFGENFTDKIQHIKGIQQTIPENKFTAIRGELVITDDDFATMNATNEWKNPRNTVAGLMNRKEWDADSISNISFICYTILGNEYSKEEQFKLLDKWGFITSVNKTLDINYNTIVNDLFIFANSSVGYDCDGLVISDIDYHNEDKYYPDQQAAFKVNKQVGITTLIDVDWGMPSKDGKLVPVGILEPIELGEVLVSRVTLHNCDFIESHKLKYGCKVRIQRSGDVIPYLVEVTETPINAADIEFITECPDCGSKVIKKDMDLYCINNQCPSQLISQLNQFIRRLNIKNVSEATLNKWKIYTIADLLKFSPSSKYKTEVNFYKELTEKLFAISDDKIFSAMNFSHVAGEILNKIISFYGWDAIKGLADYINNEQELMAEFNKLVNTYGYPDGVGELLFGYFRKGYSNAIRNTMLITTDDRYNPINNVDSMNNSTIQIIGSICVTGSLKTMSRANLLKMAKDYGYISKPGVTKDLTYLINNDLTSTSSKNRKAKELNIKIISEQEFLTILKHQTQGSELSLEDL